MRSVSSQLMQEIMNGTIINCLKLTLKDGDVYGYTDYDQNITVDSVLYKPAPGLQKVKMTVSGNAEVSNQTFGSAWVDAPEGELRGGKFDNATIEVAWASWKNPQYGKLVVFTGQLGEITWTEDGFSADIVSFMKSLSKNLGNVFTANCRHTLFSTNSVGSVGSCGLSPASYTHIGSIQSVQTNKWVFTVSNAQPDGYFSNGMIKFTSGYNAGLSSVIKTHTGNQVTMLIPTAFTINPGDTYEIQAGCDKTTDTCKNRFQNLNNYGGFPHIQTDASI